MLLLKKDMFGNYHIISTSDSHDSKIVNDDLLEYEKKDSEVVEIEIKENTNNNYNNIERAQRRAKSRIREIASNNIFNYAATITFDPEKVDRYDKEKCIKLFRHHFNEFKKRYVVNFKYLIIPELHKDGAVHAHMLCYIDNIEDLKTGVFKDKKTNKEFITINYFSKHLGYNTFDKIGDSEEDHEKIINYVVKYITKDLSPIGKQYYYASQGLKGFEVFYINNADKFGNLSKIGDFMETYRQYLHKTSNDFTNIYYINNVDSLNKLFSLAVESDLNNDLLINKNNLK